ncbi:MAG: non-hydrolyzing UDP-N-acetylglucosamine 2-epimerase [Treponema sp.]|uniref:non-hydrolyzing UDP-N-acetylglucosamine 2-epimerase n=1 Tax=Treponema sp. TaxID=166 RepID=UPI003FA33666
MHILTIIGARPQFIKAAVLSRYIRNNPQLGVKETIVHTGQHYDQNMSDIFFTQMDIPQPHYNLHIGSGSHGKMTGLMLEKIEVLLLELKPDVVLVYGDTNSTLAGALAASKLHIPVAHVEAGLRSYMMAMPEEQNRRLTDYLSTWLFCPTDTAVDNLKKEGIASTNGVPSADNKIVCKTGDIMYDASLYYRQKSTSLQTPNDFILLTIHRAENTDDLVRLTNIVNAINAVSEKKFIFPVHPRTKKILTEQGLQFGSHVKLIDPVGYLEMLKYEEACAAVLTDSGGVQKEAFFFQKPCITMRDTTEWVELVTSGWNTLTGADTEKIVSTIRNIHTPTEYPQLYGDGYTAEKIIEVLKSQY